LAFHYSRRGSSDTLTGTYTYSIYVKKNTSTWIFFTVTDSAVNYFNLDTGAFGTTPDTCTVVALSNGWYRISATRTLAAAAGNCGVGVANSNGGGSFTATGTESVYVWGADLRSGSSAGTYQRIAAATDYATAGFLPYLAFDGVDDVLVATPASADYLLNSVAFGAQYNALSGNGTLGSIGNSATGNSFSYINENSGTSVFNASARNDAATTVSNYVGTPDLLPHVLISIWDTGGSSIRNNSSIVTGSALTGVMTVNKFALGALGRSTNTTFGNSRIYSALFISPALTTTQSAALASWIAGKSGVTL